MRTRSAASAPWPQAHNNWGRWGDDDVLGTLNFIDAAKRVEAAALVKTGEAFSLSQPFDTNGPQKGWRRRTNPVHTMTDTGVDAERGNQGFPHGFGGADDVIAMPLQCSTQWDGLGHIFDQGKAWNGRAAGDVVTSEGDLVTGIETAAAKIVTRGVLLDVGRALGPELGRNDGELPDGFAITPEHLERTIELQGPSSTVGRGDIVVIRTGQYTRVRRDGWGDYAGGVGPGPVLHHRALAAPQRNRRDRHRHLGFRGPSERVRRRLPAPAPDRHPQPRPVPGRDVGPGRTGRSVRGGRQVRLPAHRRPAPHHRRRGLTRSTRSPSGSLQS